MASYSKTLLILSQTLRICLKVPVKNTIVKNKFLHKSRENSPTPFPINTKIKLKSPFLSCPHNAIVYFKQVLFLMFETSSQYVPCIFLNTYSMGGITLQWIFLKDWDIYLYNPKELTRLAEEKEYHQWHVMSDYG